MDETHEITCQECGQPMPGAATICASCGWDSTTSVGRPQRRSIAAMLAAGGWRLLVYGGLGALLALGFLRLQQTGPGPDLVTTLRWIALGDGGRAAELVTIHRAHEIASAAARFAVRELEPPSFEGEWAEALAPFATMNVRGWMPLLFYGADSGLAPASVAEFFRVRAVDGWGRRYRVSTRPLPRGAQWYDDSEVAADLERGLQRTFFAQAPPDFEASDWFRLELVSAGTDGAFATGDDLRLISYFPAGLTLRLSQSPGDLQRLMERAYTIGRHHFRVEGNRWDLIDARILAEFRLETLS